MQGSVKSEWGSLSPNWGTVVPFASDLLSLAILSVIRRFPPLLPPKMFFPIPFRLFLLFSVLFLYSPNPTLSLICYTCTTTLSANIDENAQVALRLFLNSVYELPPVHRFCNMEQDVEFKTIPTVQCSTPNDQCVKVRAENDGLEFVIRGCKSRVYKPDVGIPQNVHCQNGSPSLCFCKENLCNCALPSMASAATTAFIAIVFMLLFAI